MESGIVTLYDGSVVLSSASTAEEIKAVVVAIAEKFCEVSGLSIVSIVETDYGARVYIGKNGMAVIAISNAESNAKYSALYFARVGLDNYIDIGYSQETYRYRRVSYGTSSNKVFMQYVKSGDCFVCKIAYGNETASIDFPNILVSFAVTSVVSDSGERDAVSLFVQSNGVYMSYSDIIGETIFGNAMFLYGSIHYPIIPAGKDAFFDIYFDKGAKLEGIKLYTNKNSHKQFSIVTVDGKKYIPIFPKNEWQLVIEVKEEDEVQGTSYGWGGGITNSGHVDSSSVEVLGGAS